MHTIKYNMKIISRMVSAFLLICTIICCNKKADDFKSFLNGKEIIYPAKVSNINARPGNLRVALYWNPSPDPSIKKYIIYWNNKTDSLIVQATSHTSTDTVKTLINNLSEYAYTFTIYSYDSAGNRSVPFEINNVKIYGPLYQGALLNRPYNAGKPYVLTGASNLTLNFLKPDTINITTSIKYTNTAGLVNEVFLAPENNSITMSDYKSGTPVLYRSSYIPVLNALDTFNVSRYDTFPKIISYVECNKALFSELHLLNDVGAYQSNTSIYRLWDGTTTPQGYPEIFHSDGNSPLPHHLTFDMGQVYTNLSQIEETGRNCCHNPDDFEVWGIADLTGAQTTLPGNDPGWTAESIAKGWTLLKEVLRTDDGQAPFKVDLMSNPPPVRYIRIRIKHVTSNDGSYSNMSELTFWNKQ
jgi:hypothetical protein